MALELIIVVDVLKIIHSSKLLVEQFRVLVYTNGLYNTCTCTTIKCLQGHLSPMHPSLAK